MMMMNRLWLVASSLLYSAGAFVASEQAAEGRMMDARRLRSASARRNDVDSMAMDDSSCLRCEIKQLEAHGSEEEGLYYCITDNGRGHRETFGLWLPDSFLTAHESLFDSGASFCVPFEYVSSKEIVIPEDHRVQVIRDMQQTNYAPVKGTMRVLAVRVRSITGEEPEESLEEIEAGIFGTTTDVSLLPIASVTNQYRLASHGALDLQPASGPGIINGVTEITVNRQVVGSGVQADLSSAVLDATRDVVGSLDEVADRFIFCLPNGSLLEGRDSWTAFTFLYEPYSFYQQSRCNKLSVVMHELGHSFGFRHSGTDGNDYADETGVMGYAVNKYGVPRKAFNGHKHWLTGWFTDRSVQVNPASGGAVSVRLVAFVDYGNENLQDDDVILLRVGNLYLQYNRAKGYNIDTPNSYADHVTITKANSNADVSTLVGSITTGRSYIYDDGSDKVVIQVCNQVASSLGYDYSLLSIHLADGSQASLCSGFADIPSDGASIVPGNQDDWIVDDADPLVFESDKSENNPSATNGLLVGIIWGFVGLLFSVAVFLLYKMRRARQQHQTRPLSPPARQGSSRQRKSSRSSSRKSGRPRKTDDKESPEKAAPRKKMLEPCRTREESFSSDSTGELEHEITVESDLSFEEIVVEVDDESQIESKKELPSDA